MQQVPLKSFIVRMTENVLVTGGSGGIGSAVCRQLAKAGYHPVIGYAKGKSVAEKMALETGGTPLALDLAVPDSITAATDELIASERDLAGVVLAASPPPCIAPVFRQPETEFENHWKITVRGTRQILDGVIRQCMRPRKQGWVVAILSDAMGQDSDAAKSMGAYIVAKYGLLGLFKVLDAEYSWLDVHSVFPGYTETEMLTVFDDRFLDQLRASSPAGRFATPDEVASDILARIGTPR